MAQRAIEERQRRILGITAAGVVIPVIKGREDPDPTKPEGADPEGQASGDGGTGDPNAGTGDDGGDGTPPGKVYTEDEVQTFLRRMKAADQTAANLQKKIQEYEDKDKTELEKLQRDFAEAQARADKAEADLMKTRVHNKFLASNKYTWHNPEVALKLLDIDSLTFTEDGQVQGLEQAIQDLAKANPFLVKDESGGGGQKKSGGGRPSGGQPPANNSGGSDRDKERAALLKKYPQLSR